MDQLIDMTLLVFLVILAAAILHMRSLVTMAMLFGMYSLLTAGLFVVMDAPDVAFTEAAVGAGISTILLLATIAVTGITQEKADPRFHIPALLMVAVTGVALLYGLQDLAPMGDPQAPQHTGVAARYVELGGAETGVPNLVTAVLASYRGFDTLGEVVVIFTAGIGVLLLLGNEHRTVVRPAITHNLLLTVVAKFLIPMLILFAFYVQFHGDYSPGGGFQAGVIFSAALVLYTLNLGVDAAQQALPLKFLLGLAAAGVALYAGTGVLGILLGSEFLDYSPLGSTPVAGQHLGIMLIELGVGMCVSAVLLSIYFTFAQRTREQ